jgi:hypothetical protein
MLQYKLQNGQTLFIKGRKFEIEMFGEQKKILITPLDEINKFVTDGGLNLNDFSKPALSREPAPVISYNDLPHVEKSTMTKINATKFTEFVKNWAINFNLEDTDQPDRIELLQDVMNYHSKGSVQLLKYMGGLTHTVAFCLYEKSLDLVSPEERKFSRLLAENMAQISSIVHPTLSEYLEHPFKI